MYNGVMCYPQKLSFVHEKFFGYSFQIFPLPIAVTEFNTSKLYLNDEPKENNLTILGCANVFFS